MADIKAAPSRWKEGSKRRMAIAEVATALDNRCASRWWTSAAISWSSRAWTVPRRSACSHQQGGHRSALRYTHG